MEQLTRPILHPWDSSARAGMAAHKEGQHTADQSLRRPWRHLCKALLLAQFKTSNTHQRGAAIKIILTKLRDCTPQALTFLS